MSFYEFNSLFSNTIYYVKLNKCWNRENRNRTIITFIPATKPSPLVASLIHVDSILFRTSRRYKIFQPFHKPLDVDFENTKFIQNRWW